MVGGYQVEVPYFTKSKAVGLGTLIYVVTSSPADIPAGTSLVLVNRVAPTATTLNLPSAADQISASSALNYGMTIKDISSGVTAHAISLVPASPDTIDLLAGWEMDSSAVVLSFLTLVPIATIGWAVT
jgi:hypothetical protein